MNKCEVDELWGLPAKCVNEDIVFALAKGYTYLYTFGDLDVLSESVETLRVNGQYNCKIGSTMFNFVVPGFGAICRYCLGNAVHDGAGRYHMHTLLRPEDARRHLPHAI